MYSVATLYTAHNTHTMLPTTIIWKIYALYCTPSLFNFTPTSKIEFLINHDRYFGINLQTLLIRPWILICLIYFIAYSLRSIFENSLARLNNVNNCVNTSSCTNSGGGFSCSCRLHLQGDGRVNGTGCKGRNRRHDFVAVVPFSFVGLLLFPMLLTMLLIVCYPQI